MLPFRTAIRSLRSTPLVTVVALLSLALGIGANTAIFSIVDALVLRALPVEHAARLTVVGAPTRSGGVRQYWTNPIWEQIRERQDLWDGAFAAGNVRFDASTGGETDPVAGSFVSGRYFEVLGVRPALGRLLTVDDDVRGGGADGPVAVISHAMWQTRFGGAADVVGRTLPLSGVNYVIVGVAARSFLGHTVGSSYDVWVPLGTEPVLRGSASALDRRSTWWMQVFIRARPDQSPEAVSALLGSITPQVREATIPENWRPQDQVTYLAEPLSVQAAAGGISSLRNRYERPLMALAVVVGLTLLIACGNIANLMLARASARRHEFAVRTALGAPRWRVARDLLAENLILSAVGAALGLLLALWASRLIVQQLSTSASQVALDIGLDLRMLGFTAGIAVLTTLLFGVGPAVLAANAPPMDALKEQGRGSTSGRQKVVANSLVVAQVSLSLLLIIGAGLFVRSFVALADVELGFEPQRALVANIGTTRAGVASEQRHQLYDEVLRRVQSIPGVTQAGLSVITPVSGSTWNDGFVFAHLPNLPEEERIVDLNFVTPGWFATYGTRLLRGRDFDARDRVGTPLAVVVNESFVKKYFEGMDPLGQVVRSEEFPSRPTLSFEIVGVVEDAVYRSPREPIGPVMYRAFAQEDDPGSSVLLTVRAATDDGIALRQALTAAITGVNPNVSLSYRPLEEYVDAALAQERLVAMLSGFFGGLALLLAAIGLYGITAYSVVRRRAEIGIRLALGANPARLVRQLLSRTGALVVSGMIIGGAASWWLSRFVSTLLFGLEPNDPTTLAGALMILATVSAVAAWIPARRAALVNPLEALREG